MRFLVGVGNIFVFGGLVVFSISAIVLTNEALRRHPVGFLAFWAFIPVVSWWLTLGHPHDQVNCWQFFTRSALNTFTSFLVTSVCFLSVLVFLNWKEIRNDVGMRYVQGFYAARYTSIVYADHWYAERAMWLFEVAMVLGILAFPAITLVSTEKALNYHEAEEARSKAGNPHIRTTDAFPTALVYDGFDQPGITELLERWGLSVLRVTTATDAERGLRLREFDLIILDSWDSYIRAHIDGFAKFSAHILFLDFEGQNQAFLSSKGYTHILDKPVDPESLRKHVQELLGEKVPRPLTDAASP
jgi:hypothetical protein